MTHPAGIAPRMAALTALQDVRQGRALRIDTRSDFTRLSPSDRRLAYEIAAGVLRQRTALDRVIRGALTRPQRRLPATTEDILRMGAYQIVFLDRVPPHAAVNSAVTLTRSHGDDRLAPLVNAVLRRLATEPGRPGASNAALSLADRYSHPSWLVDRWLAVFGPERTEALLAHNNARPVTTLRPVRWSGAELRSALDDAGVSYGTRGEHVTIEGGQISALPGYQQGAFIVQDPTQSRLLDFAAFPPDVLVWDACAAPGGKAIALSDRHRVAAADVSQRRLRRLRENLKRTADGGNVFAVCADATRPPLRDSRTGAVLADVPCTATGTMQRHPEARWLLTPERIDGAMARQAAIFDGLAPTVSPGGLLVYLTCSVEPEENQYAVDAFLDRHPHFVRDANDLRLFPPETGTDGGFGARLRRAR